MPSSRFTGAPSRLRAIVLGGVLALSGCMSDPKADDQDGGGGGGDKPEPEPAGEVRLSSDSYAISEDGGSVAVTVDRVNGSSGVLTVDYATVQLAPDEPQRAVAGEDYEPASGTLRFGDGETQRVFTVPIADDGADNPDLLFEVELTNATTVATAPNQAEVRIVDDDGGGGGTVEPGQLELSAAAYAVGESDGSVTISVERVNGTDGTVAVDYSTQELADDPAHAVAGEDYVATSGRLTFDDGEAQRAFTVPVADDDRDNPDLAFAVVLSNASTGTGSPTQATVTITDDDAAPSPGSLRFSSADYSVGEGGGSVTVTVERANGSDGSIGVDYATRELADDPAHAVAGEDYAAASGRLAFADGETQEQFTIAIADDGEDNPDLAFEVVLSNASSDTTSPAVATVTITDDDAAPSPGSLRFSTADYSVGEDGGSVTVTVERTNGSDGSIGVDYATRELAADPSHAVAGEDYAAASGRLTFADGETQEQFTVSIADDGQDNPDLAFQVVLSNASSGTISPDEATVTIVDDDPVETSDVTLNWTAPTTREDGTALSLSQIGGYVVYSGTDPGALTQEVRIEDGTATSHTVTGLAPGTYYFSVGAFDADDLEGPQSATVAATVQ